MFEIKFTIDATPELIGAMRDLAGAIHHVSRPMPARQREQKDSHADTCDGSVKCEAVDKAQNLTAEAPIDPKQAKTPTSAEETKNRRPRAKKSPSESRTPVSPAIGDNLSPAAEADPERETQEEMNAPETATDTEPTVARAEGTDPLAGKGQTGEILAELTRKAIGDLDARGVDRGDANRRIRDYCARNEIKFPTFPALLQAVGYAEAIEICKGAMK